MLSTYFLTKRPESGIAVKFRSSVTAYARRLSLLLILTFYGSPVMAANTAYQVDLRASDPLKSLLTEHLDLFRYQNREDLDSDQIAFMIDTVAAQVEKLAATQGYFSPRTQTQVETVSGKKIIRLQVESGPRTSVSSVKIEVAGAVTEEAPGQVQELKESWLLKAGDPFTQEDWAAAKQAGLMVLQQRLFPAARLADSEARIYPDKNSADLAADYDSGPLFRFGKTTISGTSRYPESIVRNVNPLYVGEPYSSDRLLEFQRQLLKTGYFSNAVIDIDNKSADPERAPVNVRVSEFPKHRVRGGVGYTTDTGARLDGLYSNYDIFNRAWVLDVRTQIEQRRQLGSITLSMPPGPGAWVNSGNGSIDRTTLEGAEIMTRRIGIRRARSTDLSDTAFSVQYFYDELQQIDGAAIPASIVVQPGAHQALVAGIEKTWRQVDDPIYPRKGHILSVEAGVALKGVLTDQTFFRVASRARKYVPIGARDLVILRGELGAVITNGDNLSIPASLLFRTGGTESVRGYPFQSIGKEVNSTVYPTRYMATGGAEYLHWLTETWGGAVFYDVGTATDNWSGKQLYHAVGVGARWRSPVGRINVDLAYGIQANSIRPHFSLGVAF